MYMNNTLSNGLLVLEHLASNAKSYSVSGLARELELPKSHVHRLLQTLVESDYVMQDEKRQYRIGLGSLRMVRSLLLNIPVRTHGYHFVTRLAHKIQMTCTIAMPFGDHAISIAMLTHDGRLRDPISSLGNILYAHRSASGKLFLAYKEAEELERILARLEYDSVTEHTHKDGESLHKDLIEIAQRDCSINNQENGERVISIAVPIRNPEGEVFAGLGVSAFIEEFPEHKQQYVISELRACVKQIETSLKGVTHAHSHSR